MKPDNQTLLKELKIKLGVTKITTDQVKRAFTKRKKVILPNKNNSD